jgi:hypothetical protein
LVQATTTTTASPAAIIMLVFVAIIKYKYITVKMIDEPESTQRWKSNMTLHEVADLIERFLENKNLYPQEWNDLVDTSQRDSIVNQYRVRCYELDPLVNSHVPPDVKSVAELRLMITKLRQALGESHS